MIGLIIAIIIFNILAFKTNKNLSGKQIAHIWCFTTAFQMTFDAYVDVKYHAYWYFTKNVDWAALPANTMLLPPVNMMFLNWYPFKSSLIEQIRYFVYWEVCLLTYESITLLPEPWGYFHYGWWNLGFSAIVNPILLLTLLAYYKKFAN
ncbi:MAG: hypothetical protein ACQEWV_13650 [Bacillota bacterium]